MKKQCEIIYQMLHDPVTRAFWVFETSTILLQLHYISEQTWLYISLIFILIDYYFNPS